MYPVEAEIPTAKETQTDAWDEATQLEYERADPASAAAVYAKQR